MNDPIDWQKKGLICLNQLIVTCLINTLFLYTSYFTYTQLLNETAESIHLYKCQNVVLSMKTGVQIHVLTHAHSIYKHLRKTFSEILKSFGQSFR